MRVRAFRGWRPRADLAERIASPPYDVVNTDEARDMATGNEYSFLHVVRAEIDLDPGIDLYDDRVYDRAAQNYRAMIEQGWMVQDPEPSFYVYRQVMDGRSQTGFLGAASVDDYLEGRVLRHEHTRPAKENDRVRVNEALSANPGPVMLTHRPDPQLKAIVARVVKRTPDVSFTTPEGVDHVLWRVAATDETREVEARFEAIPATYVADGHHRAAAAARVASRRRSELAAPTGDEPCGYFLAVHFPSDELHVMDYNRVVADLHGLTPEAFVSAVRDAGFEVRPGHSARRPPGHGSFGMFVAGAWYLLVPDAAWRSDDAVDGLDVSLLTDRLLRPVLGIDDLRTDPRIDFVGGIRGMEGLETRVKSGRDAVAFAIHPTGLEEVMAVADAGKVMPPKSTWFEPKLRSGLVVHSLEGEAL